jgi:hypothetical protein
VALRECIAALCVSAVGGPRNAHSSHDVLDGRSPNFIAVVVHVWRILDVYFGQSFRCWYGELKVSYQLWVASLVDLVLDESGILLFHVPCVLQCVLSFSNVIINLLAHLLDSLCFLKECSPFLLEIGHISVIVRGDWIY